MSSLEAIVATIKAINPMQAHKLGQFLLNQDPQFFATAEFYLKKYQSYLRTQNRDLEFAVSCYLNMIEEMKFEHVQFLKTGCYRHSSFEEVARAIYFNKEVTSEQMCGLMLSQFLWRHHYAMFSFFRAQLPNYAPRVRSCLEIGPGHGLFLYEALQAFPMAKILAVDVSAQSVEIADFITENKVDFIVDDIFNFRDTSKFSFITMGEVLEHVERPQELLTKIRSLLCPHGVLFITVPANAPTVDHVYLFHNADEIRTMIEEAGFKIELERISFAEEVSPARAQRLKVTLMYGAFCTH